MKSEYNREKLLLKKIECLSSDLIFHIYEYMTGKAKFVCNKKYEYLEKNIKDDCKKKYVFWKSLNMCFELLTKEKIITYLRNIIIPNHPTVIDRIWYHSLVNDEYYTGKYLLDLWEKDAVNILYYTETITAFNNRMRMRVIDAIYYYILQSITNFATYKKIHLNHPLYVDSDILHYGEIFLKMDRIHRLCRSIELQSFEKYKK
jgi:hypothetical protein